MSRPPLVVLLHGVQSAASTFWRVAADLRELGCEVVALDLAGHGARAAVVARDLTELAEDVGRQLDHLLPGRTVDLLVGHSLGALTSLTLAAARPERVSAVMAEDPPALGPDLDPRDVAASVEYEASRARTDPDGAAAAYRALSPLWAAQDIGNAVTNLQALDASSVAGFLRTAAIWDLPSLIINCPVPVTLLLARGPGSALGEPARTRIVKHLPADRVVEVESGHSIHRDRPGVWVATVMKEVWLRP